MRRRTQVVRERSAKPLCSGSNPLGASKNCGMRLPAGRQGLSIADFFKIYNLILAIRNSQLACRDGGIGRRTGLKILCPAKGVRVRVPLSAHDTKIKC